MEIEIGNIMKIILVALAVMLLTINAMGEESALNEQDPVNGTANVTTTSEAATNETNGNTTGVIPPNEPSTKESQAGYNPYVLIVAFLILVLFAAIPLIHNNIKAHQRLERTDQVLGEILKSHKEALNEDFLKVTKEYLDADPGGAPGTARGTMALSIVMLIGICLIMLLMIPSGASNQLVKDVVLALTGALTTIIGFYFGGNGSTEPKK
jgi:hypothetical protein